MKLKKLIVESNKEDIDVLASDIESVLKKDLSALKSELESIESGDVPTEITEGPVAMLLTVILSSPGVLKTLGAIVNSVAKLFKGKSATTKGGDWLIKLGRQLEGYYVNALRLILKKTGIAKRAGLKTNAEIDKAAHVLLYSILAVAAIQSGVASISTIQSALSSKAASTAVAGTAAYGTASAVFDASETTSAIRLLLRRLK